MEKALYHEITPEGFGIAIEKDEVLFSEKSLINRDECIVEL